MSVRIVCVAVAAVLAGGSWSQVAPWRIDVGYAWSGGSPSQFSYRLAYRGVPVTRAGALPTPTSIGEGILSAASAAKDAFGVSLERDRASFDGALFDLLALKALDVEALRNARFAASVSGRFGQRPRLTTRFGLESAPVHPLGVGGVSNNLVLGLSGQMRRAWFDGGVSDDDLVASYRAFVGKAFGGVLTVARRAHRDGILEEVRRGGFPPDRWVRLSRSHADRDVRAILALAIAEAEGEPGTQALLERVVSAYFGPVQPQFAVWFDAEGAYRLDPGEGAPWRDTYAWTLTWWPAAQVPDALRVQLLYENGFRAAAPDVRSAGWILRLGIAF